jgi:hypothetical protein
MMGYAIAKSSGDLASEVELLVFLAMPKAKSLSVV